MKKLIVLSTLILFSLISFGQTSLFSTAPQVTTVADTSTLANSSFVTKSQSRQIAADANDGDMISFIYDGEFYNKDATTPLSATNNDIVAVGRLSVSFLIEVPIN